MKKLISITLMAVLLSSCCISQIPTQYYFANDSCEFYLPDYSQAVEVRDNCCVEGFSQTPNSGTLLTPGVDVEVTLIGTDCVGNTVSMSFDVVVIDSVPPTFWYDSTQFISMGQYQNDERIFKLYVTLDSTDTDEYGNPAIAQYYRDPNHGHRPIQTNIYDDSFQQSTLDNPDDWRAQTFIAPSNYSLTQVRLKIFRIGYMAGQDLIVELREMDEVNNPTGDVLSRGLKRMSEIFSDTAGAWYTVPMRKTTIYQEQHYAVIVRLSNADSENKLVWRTNESGLSSGFTIWTNNGADETGNWQRNYTADRLFEIWGKPI